MTETLAQAAPLLEATMVRKSYANTEVLRGVSLTVQTGEVVSVIGPSGSGKSTFLRCINYLEPFDSGSIRILGRAIGYHEVGTSRHEPMSRHELSLRQIAKRRTSVGMVFQQFNLFQNMTAIDNIVLAPRQVKRQSRAEAYTRAETLLERVGLADRRNFYPSQLSGGQQQRVAIARALAMEPELLLLDEPTSALDPEIVGEVLQVIEELAKSGFTMIVVTHEMKFAKAASDRIVFMSDGLIVEQGSPTILDDPRSDRLKTFLGLVQR